eukprot:gene14304-16440_t
MAEIFKGECKPEEEELLLDLLHEMFQQEDLFHRVGGNILLMSMLQTVGILFSKIVSEANVKTSMQSQVEHFLQTIPELQDIATAALAGRCAATSQKVVDTPVFADILKNSNYITHYKARHEDFSSPVVVVLWKTDIPGPAVLCDGMCVVYVERVIQPADGSSQSWRRGPPPAPKEFTESDMEETARVNSIIKRNQNAFFSQHSNLIAIRASGFVEGKMFIDFVVLAKGMVPVEVGECLPRELEGVPTRVRTGLVELCGRQEQTFHRPMLPGAGFAVGSDAQFHSNSVNDSDYLEPLMGTLGGTYHDGEDIYSVACAHSVLQQRRGEFHPVGTSVYQPCAMGRILSQLDDQTIYMYDRLKVDWSAQYAMKWLLEHQGTIDADLPADAECGTLCGAILGPLSSDGTSVDCALIKLAAEMKEEYPLWKEVYPACPPLRLGDGATPIRDINDFPYREFKVYGRGATTDLTLRATVDPTKSQIWCRPVTQGKVSQDVYHCVQAVHTNCWHPGDSGTWCWNEDGQLVGMGVARAKIDRIDYCCILPMHEVVAAIEHLLALKKKD